MWYNETLETIHDDLDAALDSHEVIAAYLREVRDKCNLEVPYDVWKAHEDVMLAMEDSRDAAESFDSLLK